MNWKFWKRNKKSDTTDPNIPKRLEEYMRRQLNNDFAVCCLCRKIIPKWEAIYYNGKCKLCYGYLVRKLTPIFATKKWKHKADDFDKPEVVQFT
jgi:hypothetical protein